MKRFMLLFTLLILIGCGGGGGGESNNLVTGWTGPVNSSQYPDVEGRYTLSIDPPDVICTDGSKGTSKAETSLMAIKQNVASLAIYQVTTQGNIIYIDDPTTGNVDKNGVFVMSNDYTSYISGLVGINDVTVKMNGSFTVSGFHGTYILTIHNRYINGGCTYSSKMNAYQTSSVF